MQHRSDDAEFWRGMNRLVAANRIVVDRPKGSTHPRYPDSIYPLDYGYLDNTSAADGGGIDVWVGSQKTKTITGILCVYDTLKREMEIKLLIACNREDIHAVQQFHAGMYILYISNPTPDR
jgi:inorganic pyrophosphatase